MYQSPLAGIQRDFGNAKFVEMDVFYGLIRGQLIDWHPCRHAAFRALFCCVTALPWLQMQTCRIPERLFHFPVGHSPFLGGFQPRYLSI